MLAAALVVAWLGLAGRPATTGPANGSLPEILSEAEKASSAHDIELERDLLQSAERLGGSPQDVFEVQRRLAVLDWKYLERFDEARARLLPSTETEEAAKAWLAIARLERARQRLETAASAARRARELAASDLERDEAGIALARAAVARSVEKRLAGEHGASQALRESYAELLELVSRAPGYLEPSRLLLQAALILDEGETALAAWCSYFHVSPGHRGPNLVAEVGPELEQLLPSWQGAGESTVALVEALSTSRLHTEAALVALAPSAPPEVRRASRARAIVGYARFLGRIRDATEEHYRRTMVGEGSRQSWQAELRAAMGSLERVLDQSPLEPAVAPPVLSVDPSRVGSLDSAVVEILARRFGTYLSIGTTAGYFDLHLGHVVAAEERTVEQYGRRAELSFFVLDTMLSNGFQSWAWEDGAQHGGWNKPNGIYQVRPAYVGKSLRAWRRLHSEEELEELSNEIERQSRLDEERAARDPYTYLPGLALRLEHQGLMNLRSELESRHLDREELKLAFLAAYDEAVLESSIFAHEGRHAIDKRHTSLLGFARNSELTAKLSEVAFAPRPRLSLGAIISPNIGDGTPHGRANLAIMKGLVRWMRQHQGELAGFDSARPLLPQLDLLSDERLREAFRSMDRLARTE